MTLAQISRLISGKVDVRIEDREGGSEGTLIANDQTPAGRYRTEDLEVRVKKMTLSY